MRNGQQDVADNLYQERCTRFILPWVKDNVKELLLEGKRVQALKFIRDYTHYSFQESRKVLEGLEVNESNTKS